MLRIALTGGIATGKSYVLQCFAAAGVPTIDADALVHTALSAGSPAITSIVSRFGNQVLASDGGIDRKALADIVFADIAARADLEAILHPQVYRLIDEWFGSLASPDSPDVRESRLRSREDHAGYGEARRSPAKAAGRRDLAVADIPLLFETHHEGDFDRVIVTACPPDVQLERLKRRNGLSERDAARRVAAQWPVEEKVRRADFVIDTSGTFEETGRQVGRILERLRAEG